MLTTTRKIRLVIADDQDVVRAGLKLLLSRQKHLECIGCAVSGSESLDLASRLRPDVIVMDITMSSADGLNAIRKLAMLAPETKVLAFTVRPAASLVLAALRAGTFGYVSQTSPLMVLIEGISVVAKSKRFIDPELTDPMLRTFLDEPRTVAEAFPLLDCSQKYQYRIGGPNEATLKFSLTNFQESSVRLGQTFSRSGITKGIDYLAVGV